MFSTSIGNRLGLKYIKTELSWIIFKNLLLSDRRGYKYKSENIPLNANPATYQKKYINQSVGQFVLGKMFDSTRDGVLLS